MITKLDKISDISTEFGTTLASAKQMSWFYNNKNPDSPVQPVMRRGKITDWIGYDHSANDPLTQWRYYYNFAKFFDEIQNPPGQYSSYIQVNHSKTGPAASKERCILYSGPNITDYTKSGYIYIMGSSTSPTDIMVRCDFNEFWKSTSTTQRRFTIGLKYFFNAVNGNLLLANNVKNTDTSSFGLVMNSGYKYIINSLVSAMLDTNGQIIKSVVGKEMVALLHINGQSNCSMSLYDVSADSLVSYMFPITVPNIAKEALPSNKIFALLNGNADTSLGFNSGRLYKVAYDDKYIINNKSQALECARLFV